MEVIGRDNEISILSQMLKEDTSQFVAVYGRRRVGKTYLIKQVYESKIVFECTALNYKEDEDSDFNMNQQLENFLLCLKENGHNIRSQISSWLSAFKELQKYIESIKKKKKKVIFLDELPWFDTPKSGFLAAFGNFWNRYCVNRKDIVLVICGSAAQWIIENVINNNGGLHNRLTRTLLIEPFSLSETKKYLKHKRVSLTDKDIIKLYMCIGGIPYYLNGVVPGRSIPHILDDLFFSKNAFLFNEFNNLYKSLFNNHERHVNVITALATSLVGMTRQEILEKSKIASGGTFSSIVSELEECGFISRYTGIDKNKEGALYRLTDEYSCFYLRFLKKNKKQTGSTLTNSQSFKIWSGYAFENLCIKHIDKIAYLLGISGILYDIYSFKSKADEYNKGSQIDLIIDRSDNCVNIVEIKFYEGKFRMTPSYADYITNKIQSFITKKKSKKTVFLTLITSDGSERNPYYLQVVTNEFLASQLI